MIKSTILLTQKWNLPVDYLDSYSLFIRQVNKYPLISHSAPLRGHADPGLICLRKLFVVGLFGFGALRIMVIKMKYQFYFKLISNSICCDYRERVRQR